jgi:hypothetical protein
MKFSASSSAAALTVVAPRNMNRAANAGTNKRWNMIAFSIIERSAFLMNAPFASLNGDDRKGPDLTIKTDARFPHPRNLLRGLDI